MVTTPPLQIKLFENKDNALPHCTHSTVKFLCKEVSDFIPLELWPPCSRDLNTVDYTI